MNVALFLTAKGEGTAKQVIGAIKLWKGYCAENRLKIIIHGFPS